MRALTDRQRQVLRLVAAGHTNKQIGRRLNTVESTINRHLHEIYKRMGVNDRAHAVTLAIYHGEITLADLAAIAEPERHLHPAPEEQAA